MTVHSYPGGEGALGRQVRAIQSPAIQNQGKKQASVHLVTTNDDDGVGTKQVDDGAHGTHDYGVDLHQETLDRLKAHGSRLDEHDNRIKRLEGAAKAQLGAPGHHK